MGALTALPLSAAQHGRQKSQRLVVDDSGLPGTEQGGAPFMQLRPASLHRRSLGCHPRSVPCCAGLSKCLSSKPWATELQSVHFPVGGATMGLSRASPGLSAQSPCVMGGQPEACPCLSPHQTNGPITLTVWRRWGLAPARGHPVALLDICEGGGG